MKFKPMSKKQIQRVLKELKKIYSGSFSEYEGEGKIQTDQDFIDLIMHFDMIWTKKIWPELSEVYPVLANQEVKESEFYDHLIFSECWPKLVMQPALARKMERKIAEVQNERNKQDGEYIQ